MSDDGKRREMAPPTAPNSNEKDSDDGFQVVRRRRINGSEQRRRRNARAAGQATQQTTGRAGNASAEGNTIPSGSGRSPLTRPLPQGKGDKESVKPRPAEKKKSAPKTQAVKRPRSDGSNPSPREHQRKKVHRQNVSKAEAPQGTATAWREAMMSHLKVAVISTTNILGKLGKDQYEKVYDLITDLIMEELAKGNPPPTFKHFSYAGEIFRITCENDVSLRWLRSIVEKLTPWEGAKLTIVAEKDLPKLYRFSVWIPKAINKLSEPAKVVGILGGQNPHLQVKSWLIFHHHVEEAENNQGMVFVFGVGQKDADWLKQNRGKLNFLLSTVWAKFASQKEEVKEKDEKVEAVGEPSSAVGESVGAISAPADASVVAMEVTPSEEVGGLDASGLAVPQIDGRETNVNRPADGAQPGTPPQSTV